MPGTRAAVLKFMAVGSLPSHFLRRSSLRFSERIGGIIRRIEALLRLDPVDPADRHERCLELVSSELGDPSSCISERE